MDDDGRIIRRTNPGDGRAEMSIQYDDLGNILEVKQGTSSVKYKYVSFTSKHLYLLLLLSEYTVSSFNTCTKWVGNPGITHDCMPDCHPVSWAGID